jgi:two-component system phosphate regulon sensor histidine kinase PhoR
MKKMFTKAALIYTLITGSGFLLLYFFMNIEKRPMLWQGYAAVFAVCLIVFLLFVRHHTRIIARLNEQARSFANGDLSVRVTNNSDDELGELSNSMQNMAENIQQKMQQTLREKGQMETILASMAEGVLAFDATGRLLLINKSAEFMLNVCWEEMHERYFLEILENYHIADLLNICLVDGQTHAAEVQLTAEDSEYYQVYITPIKGKNGLPQGAVMVLRNITQLRQLEKMRSEFISNVSHELRTPLTSIKGFVETLLDGAWEDRNLSSKFLTIINTEANRLNSLISDLLFLSQLESGEMEIVKDKINSQLLVENIITLLQPVAQNKNIKLECEIVAGAESFYAGYEMIEQVLINLVDNAIKYSFENGVVKIVFRPWDGEMRQSESSEQTDRTENAERVEDTGRAEKNERAGEDEHIVIEVIDHGIGIPSQSMPRIFERFYRVDKARSRQVGGTGLGLSIVKHIVEGHHGKLKVESKENSGSNFMIILPKV